MLRIGTSGWHYKDWPGVFYPATLPSSEWLEFYARHFDTVELNGVFYRLPQATAVKTWHEKTPDDFLFAYKGSRFITHMKKLTDVQEALQTMFKPMRQLREKLAIILWQLPPFLAYDADRLRRFFDALPKRYRYAMEFRHVSWYRDDIYKLLERQDIALCLHDMRGQPSPIEVPAKTVYIRFHGTKEAKYHGLYTEDQLHPWAQRMRSWLNQERDVFVYFNNDYEGHAITNARQLRDLLPTRLAVASEEAGR